MSKHEKIPVAIAWYYPEQWDRLKRVVADPENFEETHSEWLTTFEHGMRFLALEGYETHKVPVDVDELLTWCLSQKRLIDGAARSQFAAEKLRKMYSAEEDPA